MENETSGRNAAVNRLHVLDYVTISIGWLLAGSVAGGIGGLALGWIFAFGYHKRGMSDPADAPVYVALGLALLGACVGAILGIIIGITYSIHSSRKTKAIAR